MKKGSTLRVNDELNALVIKTARHADCNETRVFRTTVTFIHNHKAKTVEGIDVPESLYKEGGRHVKNFNFSLPDGFTAEEFRRIVAARCFVELEKPRRKIHRSYAAEAGLATRMPKTPEELEKMIASGVKGIALDIDDWEKIRDTGNA